MRPEVPSPPLAPSAAVGSVPPLVQSIGGVDGGGWVLIDSKALAALPVPPPPPRRPLLLPPSPMAAVTAATAATSGAAWELASSALAMVSSSSDAASESEFVCIAPTGLTRVRALARRRPDVVRALLWLTFGLLVLGELGTTTWWLYDLGIVRFLLVSMLPCISVSLALCWLSQEQVLTTTVSLFMAVLPALPAYSAVILILPSSRSAASAQCKGDGAEWEVLHWPALLSVAVLYLSSAVLPTLRAEFQSPGPRLAILDHCLDEAKRLARGFCILSAWLYVAVALHVGARHLLSSPGASPFHWWGSAIASPFFSSERGFILALHAMGLACAEARGELVKALGEELLPMLVGAQRARKLKIRTLVMKFGKKLLRNISSVRRFAPPHWAVAGIHAVRRAAPVLLPVLALLVHLARLQTPGALRLAVTMAMGMMALVLWVAACELEGLPTDPLRLLPMLLPAGTAPISRTLIGHTLAMTERLEGVRGTFAAMGFRGRTVRGALSALGLRGGSSRKDQ